jgi:hypothetical protein
MSVAIDARAARERASAPDLSALAGPLLHAAHLASFLVLLVTGVLLLVPELRAAATGGYSLVIRESHCWTGVASVALPVLVVWRYGRPLAFRDVGRARRLWKAAHVMLTAVLMLLFALTGVALWGKAWVARPLVEDARQAHDWLTYAAAALVGVHLVEVGVASLHARIVEARAAGTPR